MPDTRSGGDAARVRCLCMRRPQVVAQLVTQARLLHQKVNPHRQQRLMHQHGAANGKTGQWRVIGAVAGKGNAVAAVKAQGKAIGQGRVRHRKGGDARGVGLHQTLGIGHDANEVWQRCAPLILHPDCDIDGYRGQKASPDTGNALGAINRDRTAQAGTPCGVDQGAQFKDVVGMQVRDADGRQRFQIKPGLNQRLGHAQPAIDNHAVAIHLQQAGAGHRPAAAQRRAALGAQQEDAGGCRISGCHFNPGVPSNFFSKLSQQSM